MSYYITVTEFRKKIGYYLKIANEHFVHVTKYGKECVVLCPPSFMEFKKQIELGKNI